MIEVLMTIECRLSLLSTILAVVEIFDFSLMLKFLALVVAGIQHGICT